MKLWIIWHKRDDVWARCLFADIGLALADVRPDPEDANYYEAHIQPGELAMDLLDKHWGRLIWGPALEPAR